LARRRARISGVLVARRRHVDMPILFGIFCFGAQPY
jgi:hypothetical protein